MQTWTVYDGANPYADFDSAGSLTNRYLSAVDTLFARIDPSLAENWYLADGTGSTRQIADTGGTILDTLTYDSFGQLLSESTPSSGDRFKLADGEWQAAVPLLFASEGVYNPATGRYLNQAAAGADTNPYRRFGNNPLDAGQRQRGAGGFVTAADDPLRKKPGESQEDYLRRVRRDVQIDSNRRSPAYGQPPMKGITPGLDRFDDLAQGGWDTGVAIGSAVAMYLCGKALGKAISWIDDAFRGRPVTGKVADAAADAAKVVAKKPGRGIWDLTPQKRWEAAERLRGKNLPGNYKAIDKFQDGVATNIKSMDIAAPTYAHPKNGPKAIESKVREYIDKVAKYKGGTYANITIHPDQVQHRALDLVIPPGATPDQRKVLDAMIEYGRKNGVTVNIIEVLDID